MLVRILGYFPQSPKSGDGICGDVAGNGCGEGAGFKFHSGRQRKVTLLVLVGRGPWGSG